MNELRKISIFAQLSDNELAQIKQHSATRSYKKNTVIITEGDVTESMYVILQGRVKVYLTEDDGREIVINDLGPWNYFGELAIFDNSRRSASVITCEKSQFLIITKEVILRLLQNPDTALLIIQDLILRVKDLSTNLKDMALKDVYNRIVTLLSSLAIEKNGVTITKVPLTQEEIANRIGAARESVSRILKTLKSGGYISYQGKHIVLERVFPERF